MTDEKTNLSDEAGAMTETALLIYGVDVMEGLKQLEDESVHCVVTSPPYWGLRSYGVEGQIGLERTPEEYVEKLVVVFREVRRVLRPDGTLWLNLGDSYAGSGMGWSKKGYELSPIQKGNRGCMTVGKPPGYISSETNGLKPKDLIGIPWRVAFALQADGWYLRSDIIWHKPNPMPESVQDRPTKAHEYIFLFSRSSKYFYDSDAIREKHSEVSLERVKRPWNGNREVGDIPASFSSMDISKMCHPNGRNKRTVWTIATEPYPEAHFATFPTALVQPCILAGTSAEGCCRKCGKLLERIVEREGETTTEKLKRLGKENKRGTGGEKVTQSLDYSGGHDNNMRQIKTIGWQRTCKCESKIVPCIVLDPFSGSGTTGEVAVSLGRRYIGVDLNKDYEALARKRLGLFVN